MKRLNKKVGAVFFIISVIAFLVSLAFTTYSLILYANSLLMEVVFIGFGIALQAGTIGFAILTAIKGRIYFIPTILLALLNVTGTTSIGTALFQSEHVTAVRSDSGYTRLEERKVYYLDLIEDKTREREELPENYLTWKQRLSAEIDEHLAKVEEIDDQLDSYVAAGSETSTRMSPVTLFVTIGKWFNTEPITTAMIYYIASAIFLEMIVTIFAGVGAGALNYNPVTPPKRQQVRKPIEPTHDRGKLAQYIDVAWRFAADNGYAPGRDVFKQHKFTEHELISCRKRCEELGLVETRGTKTITVVSKDEALKRVAQS